jgi:hypothetical protein
MSATDNTAAGTVRRIWVRASALAHGRAPDYADSQRVGVAVLLPWTNRTMAESASALMAARAAHPCAIYCLQDDLGMGPLSLMSAALAGIRSDWVVYAAQDAFAGRYWLRFAVEALRARPVSRLLAFNDGKWVGRLAAFGMAQREWLRDLYGEHLFHPGYRRHYADVELSLIARQQQVMAYHPHSLLVEADYDKDSRPVDEADRAHFLRRKLSGFGGHVTDPVLKGEFG